jgi:hypothetical protein
VVHVDAEALKESAEAGQAVLGDGIRISAETARRIACDATRVMMTHDECGNVLDVGRRTRSVLVPIRRALAHCDRCCRFPGCTFRICDAPRAALGGWRQDQAVESDPLVHHASPTGSRRWISCTRRS